SFRLIASDGPVVEHFEQRVCQRGMQFQAWEVERLVEQGRSVGDILPPAESIAIMATLDEIRRQIGLEYPGE
ncbi:MAG: gfo/Idh/MocA family oxidoreductase, partial [Microbacteriaceae bacterium]|nr:gfo/Idh/MocA family oxidoreductase [Microbacteriaceae bacterium]